MDKQSAVYLSSGILFSQRKEQILIHATTWIKLRNIMLRERSQIQNVIHMECSLQANPYRQTEDEWLQDWGERRFGRSKDFVVVVG